MGRFNRGNFGIFAGGRPNIAVFASRRPDFGIATAIKFTRRTGMTQKNSMKLIPALMLLAFAGAAGASGFAIQNQTGSGTGNAFSGAAATAEDAGTIYFNPAGMTYLPMGHNITAVGTVLILVDRLRSNTRHRDVSQRGLAFAPGPVLRSIAPTGDGGDAGGTWALSQPATGHTPTRKDLRFGIGVSPTFGNETDYEKNFRGFNSGFLCRDGADEHQSVDRLQGQ
jgi:long-chain fatty acid transport protein